MKYFKRLLPLALTVSIIFLLTLSGGGAPSFARDYHRLVVMADTHLPGSHYTENERVIAQINTRRDVDLVTVLGDLCFERGTVEEYSAAKRFFSRLQKPLCPVVGNHDYIYDDLISHERKTKANAIIREEKLRRFRETFTPEGLYYEKRMGAYLLLFLSTDHLTTSRLAEISDTQLAWFRKRLEANRDQPTIVFFHAPLKGTFGKDDRRAGDQNYYAQPEEKIEGLIADNPQLFLWVSGHLHLPATNASFKSPVNLYQGRVLNIHTSDMKRRNIWTNSLYLYEDRVVVRTYDHRRGQWVENLDRTVPRPALSRTFSTPGLLPDIK